MSKNDSSDNQQYRYNGQSGNNNANLVQQYSYFPGNIGIQNQQIYHRLNNPNQQINQRSLYNPQIAPNTIQQYQQIIDNYPYINFPYPNTMPSQIPPVYYPNHNVAQAQQQQSQKINYQQTQQQIQQLQYPLYSQTPVSQMLHQTQGPHVQPTQQIHSHAHVPLPPPQPPPQQQQQPQQTQHFTYSQNPTTNPSYYKTIQLVQQPIALTPNPTPQYSVYSQPQPPQQHTHNPTQQSQHQLQQHHQQPSHQLHHQQQQNQHQSTPYQIGTQSNSTNTATFVSNTNTNKKPTQQTPLEIINPDTKAVVNLSQYRTKAAIETKNQEKANGIKSTEQLNISIKPPGGGGSGGPVGGGGGLIIESPPPKTDNSQIDLFIDKQNSLTTNISVENQTNGHKALEITDLTPKIDKKIDNKEYKYDDDKNGNSNDDEDDNDDDDVNVDYNTKMCEIIKDIDVKEQSSNYKEDNMILNVSNINEENILKPISSKRCIYTRDSILKIGKKPASKTKPEGLNKNDFPDNIILDSPLDASACVQIPNNRQQKNNTRQPQLGGHQHWRNKSINQPNQHPQKYITIDRSDLQPLSHSEEGYLTFQKRKALGEEVDEFEELKRQIKGILNKIVPQNFEQCLDDLVNLKIGTHDGMKCLVNELFLKAVKEEAYSVTFAKICSYLSQIKADVSENEIVTFRSVLLQKCQMMFTTPLEDQLKQVKVDWLEKAENEKPKFRAIMISDVEEQVKKAKDRYFGNIRFIGELYLQGVLITKIICFCMDSLMDKKDDSDSLICLCKLLETCGEKLEKDNKGRDRIQESFRKLKEWSEDKMIENRVRFRILDILEMRKSNWVLRKIQKQQKVEPKTLQEMKSEGVSNNDNRDIHYNSLNRKSSNQTWSGDRRMSVPANNSMSSMNSHTMRGRQIDNFNYKNLTVSQLPCDQKLLAPTSQSRMWNKGSGYKANNKQESIEQNIDQSKISKTAFKSTKSLSQSQSHSSNITTLNNSGNLATGASSTVSSTTNVTGTTISSSPSSSRSSSNGRKQTSNITQSNSDIKCDNGDNKLDSEHEQKLNDKNQSDNNSDMLNLKVAVTKQLIIDNMISSEDLLKLYLDKNTFCDKSWESYDNKVNVIYDWLDSTIENTNDVRNQMSGLLFGLVSRNCLDKQDLLVALTKFSEELTEMEIDIGKPLWGYYSDYLMNFAKDSLSNRSSCDFISSIFNTESSRFTTTQEQIEFISLPWRLFNRIIQMKDDSDSIKSYLITDLVVETLQKAISIIIDDFETTNSLEFSGTCTNKRYSKWINERLLESCNEATSNLFITTNWISMLNYLKQSRDICEMDDSINEIWKSNCNCLCQKTENQQHLQALSHFVAVNKSLSDRDTQFILWCLHELDNNICDEKALKTWWSSNSIFGREYSIDPMENSDSSAAAATTTTPPLLSPSSRINQKTSFKDFIQLLTSKMTETTILTADNNDNKLTNSLSTINEDDKVIIDIDHQSNNNNSNSSNISTPFSNDKINQFDNNNDNDDHENNTMKLILSTSSSDLIQTDDSVTN